jgi:hypothetical protein
MPKGYCASAPPRSLSEAYAQWRQIAPANRERAEHWLHTRLLPHLLALCADAVQRRDRDALQMWLNPPPELARAYRLLGAPLAARVQRLLQVALDALYVDATPDEPADAELVAYFRTGRWRPARRAVRLTVALADPDAPERALALTLLLERVAPTGAPYPHPAMHWRLFWDEAFQRAIDQAGLNGVRWSLSPLPADAEIAGDSLGGAFALGARLLDACPGDHRRYAILCRYDPDTERLLPVEQFQEKYDAVCAVRRVRAVLASAGQLGEPLPRVAPVDALADALRRVRRQRQRARIMRASLALPLLPLGALLWGLQQGSYTLEMTPSGRLMLTGGLIRRAPIDTGYFALELAPERLPTGRRLRWRTHPAEYDPAPYHEIADALLDPLAQATCGMTSATRRRRSKSSNAPARRSPPLSSVGWRRWRRCSPRAAPNGCNAPAACPRPTPTANSPAHACSIGSAHCPKTPTCANSNSSPRATRRPMCDSTRSKSSPATTPTGFCARVSCASWW